MSYYSSKFSDVPRIPADCSRDACNRPVEYFINGRPKKYCSDYCRGVVKRSRRHLRDPNYADHLRKLNRERNRRNYHDDPAYRAYVLANSHARRADKLGVDGIGSRMDLTAYLMERDNKICQLCFEPIIDGPFELYDPAQPSIDHIIPLSKGGTHELSNLQLAHLLCNWSKGNRYELELESLEDTKAAF